MGLAPTASTTATLAIWAMRWPSHCLEEGIERRRLCAISSRRRVGTASLAESQGPDASRSGHPARGSNGHGPSVDSRNDQ